MPTPSTSLSAAIVGPVTVSGTVTADQGAAGAAAWLVDGSAHTQPISAASLPLPTGAAQDATLTNGNARIGGTVAVTQSTSPWVTSGTSTVSGTVAVSSVAGTVTVDGSGVTQPISAESLPLPDGAATEDTLATVNGAVQDSALTAIIERDKLATDD